MLRNRPVYVHEISAAIVLLLLAVKSWGDTKSASEQLLRVLAAEQDRSLSKIQTLAVRRNFEYMRSTPRGVERQKGSLYHIFDGPKSVAVVDREYVGKPLGMGDGTSVLSGRQWVIAGDSSVFTFAAEINSAHLMEFDSSRSRPKDLNNLVDMHLFAQPLRFGFGVDDITLKEAASPRFQVRHRVEAEPAADGTNYIVRVFHRPEYVPDVAHPIWEMTVDSKQGYLITEGLMRDPDGKVYRHIKSRGAEVQPGVWFSVEWDDTFYGPIDPRTGQAEIFESKHCTSTEVKINPDLPEDTFTWQSLKLPDGTRVTRTTALGKTDTMTVQGNELIPSRLIQKGSSRLPSVTSK